MPMLETELETGFPQNMNSQSQQQEEHTIFICETTGHFSSIAQGQWQTAVLIRVDCVQRTKMMTTTAGVAKRQKRPFPRKEKWLRQNETKDPRRSYMLRYARNLSAKATRRWGWSKPTIATAFYESFFFMRRMNGEEVRGRHQLLLADGAWRRRRKPCAIQHLLDWRCDAIMIGTRVFKRG